MVGDDLDWRGDQVQAALKTLRRHARLQPTREASRLTWDQATKKLAAGGCAFESMNDSAFGELVAARRAARARTSERRRSPAPTSSFLAVVDVFVAATKAKNAKNALAFLGRHQRARHAARVQPGKGVGPGRSATSTSRR